MNHSKRPFLSAAMRMTCVCVAALTAACTEQNPNPAPKPKPDAEKVKPANVDVARYDLSGEYDWDRDRLAATVKLTLKLTADGPQEITLDSAVAEVKAVRAAGGAALPFTIKPEEEQLKVELSGLPGLVRGGETAIEIEYEAASQAPQYMVASLVEVPARKGDPVSARTLYTESEPRGAKRWMPCHNVTEDRAVFSAELRMSEKESMISNGDLVADEVKDGKRRMKYETAYPLPTYLMAFAVSEFKVESIKHGDLPVSVWYRSGSAGDYTGTLAELSRLIGKFETLLGPYPYEKYALVFLPTYPGGMENVGITFQEESSAEPKLTADLDLTAHELGHQWFGDLVTVKTWDDLWIKEGMATLLGSEGTRVYLDESGAGTLNADEFYAIDGEAIRDVSLPPEEKFTSGPYGRAAWLYTQIRSLVGEEAFWKTLRGVLEEHRFGAVGTDAILDAFAPALGADLTERARRAVDAKSLPKLEIAPAPTPGGSIVTLRDPDGALVAPMDVLWVAEDGTTRAQTLEVDKQVELTPQGNEMLIFDPLDRHLEWSSFIGQQALATPALKATSPKQVSYLLDAAGGAHQLASVLQGLPDIAPDEFKAFVGELDSERAKAVSIQTACKSATAAGVDPAVRDAWAAVLKEILSGQPYTYGLGRASYTGRYAACTELVAPADLFAKDWEALKGSTSTDSIDNVRLWFLSMFDLPPALALSAWGNVALNAGSLRARSTAVWHLDGYIDALSPEELAKFRALFVDVLNGTEAVELLYSDIPAVERSAAPTAAENAAGLAGLSQVLKNPLPREVHGLAVCAAFHLTKGDASAWSAFVAALKDKDLASDAEDNLANPMLCQ